MPILYGWGAALVILGALFKINHYPGATLMLAIGMSVEALIFFCQLLKKQLKNIIGKKLIQIFWKSQKILKDLSNS